MTEIEQGQGQAERFLHYKRGGAEIRVASLVLSTERPSLPELWNAVGGLQINDVPDLRYERRGQNGSLIQWFEDIQEPGSVYNEDRPSLNWELMQQPDARVATKVFAFPSEHGCNIRVMSVDEFSVLSTLAALQDYFHAERVEIDSSYDQLIERLWRRDKETAGDIHSRISFRGIELKALDMTMILEADDEYWSLQQLTANVDKVAGSFAKSVQGIYLSIDQTDVVAFQNGLFVLTTDDTPTILRTTGVVTSVFSAKR